MVSSEGCLKMMVLVIQGLDRMTEVLVGPGKRPANCFKATMVVDEKEESSTEEWSMYWVENSGKNHILLDIMTNQKNNNKTFFL